MRWHFQYPSTAGAHHAGRTEDLKLRCRFLKASYSCRSSILPLANDLQLLEKPGVQTDVFLQPSEEVSTQNDGEEIRGEPDLLPPMRELE